MLLKELPHHPRRVDAAAERTEQPFRAFRPAEPLVACTIDRVQLNVRSVRAAGVFAPRYVSVQYRIDRLRRAAVPPRPPRNPRRNVRERHRRKPTPGAPDRE